MTKIVVLTLLVPAFLLGFALVAKARNPSAYKYLFRNTILSKSKKYELAAVLRGRVYYPRYFYIPILKQYVVYSNVDESGPFRFYEPNTKPYGNNYALLDETGKILQSFETPLRFSSRSGCFYGPKTYIPWLETRRTDTIPYHKVHNKNLDLCEADFNKLFMELYQTSDYVEYINLRASTDDLHQAGVIFQRKGYVEILLSGLRDSRMIRHFQEDRSTNNFEDYYTPDIRNGQSFPQSKAAIEMLSLKSSNPNPFVYWRHWFKYPFRIEKYGLAYSSGWQGIMKLHGIPIYVPGEGSGTAYVRFKVKNDVFRIKILEVEKMNLIPLYGLGLRTFELPEHVRTQHSLVFMESVQNSGENRLGGGVYVVRKSTQANASDIPAGMSEEHFNTLPINLQEALMNPDSGKGLILRDKNITKWIPDLERLQHLKYLELSTAMTEIPDEISKLSKLEVLTIEHGNIYHISPKIADLRYLKELNLFSNKLDTFPAVFLQLKNLKRLNIGANEISSLPLDIDRMEQLEYLSLTLTKVRSLPASMIGMKKLHISDSQNLRSKVSEDYKHLFEYDK
jgi:hypothetical protein